MIDGGRERAGTKSDPDTWLGYYSRKRIVHQWMQLYLLGASGARRVLEIGPALGLVSAMLQNAGYAVTTLDMNEQSFDAPRLPHIQKNILDLEPSDIQGFDAILCCETLEHIPWERVDGVLRVLHASGARHAVVSVPYMGFQMTLDLYLNRHRLRQYFSLKKLLFLKTFAPEPEGGHQWEVGYRGRGLRAWEDKLRRSGFAIRRRDFSAHCRSVFHLLEAEPR